MRGSFKIIGVSAMALALAFSGCGKGKRSSSGSSKSEDASKEVESASKSESKSESESRFGSGSPTRAGRFRRRMGKAEIQAETSAMAMYGRKLHQAIMIANISRENAGKSTAVWPRTGSEDGMKSEDVGEQDIGDRVFSSATDYFNALFDMEHYGTSDWAPEVEDLNVDVLGKDVLDGKKIRAAGLDWYIAANVRDEMQDVIPVLISANFNPALLLNKWDGHTDGTRPLLIGPEWGAVKSMFNDEAIVVVRKGGAAEVIQKKYLTYDVLYKKQAFDLTDMNPPLKYLTPTGVVEPAGHR